ncbi:MAG: 3-isopropylmalate dehydratase small subunit [Sphingomonadaceae bacterium]|uniref:3-isopropylmalate dehydratase small subunit n=1 Tax=Thermaurantiacus sp. TaxID=2820283 RepID=UPI00298EE27C|nr:3-isopropylmalate dehydratase small subunit [Thermaurantiacus sp.]MCS6986071.1 3-isopropylmalate dehydratase small subunit [Sphingomonadaceae bacterium]MDW8414713.1 3-isopropylmalate dehydratase small subunit [Thermaurantiacus sp.]
MTPFTTLRAPAIALRRANIDTDLIIPGRFLKTVTRAGLGRGAFAALREGGPNPIDEGLARGARILVAGPNFGCGSSREHAPWALIDLGIRAVIAPSFADIFAGNAFRNGLLTVSLPEADVADLMDRAEAGETITIDLGASTVSTEDGRCLSFAMDPFRRTCLLEGLDEIALTEREEGAIAAFEARLAATWPWVPGAARRG